MRSSLLAATIFASFAASAEGDSFGTRVQRAKLSEASTEGAEYRKILWQKIGNDVASVMQQCFPRGVEADVEAFILVGDVTTDCHIHNVEARPSTPMVRCFASAFSAISFPELPESLAEQGVPLEIDMKIKP